MIVRKCAKNHKLYIFRPRTNANINVKYTLPDKEIIDFDTQGKTFIVTLDGAVIKRSNSWKTAQSSYLVECEKLHSNSTGELKRGVHKLVNGIATVQ
jgi:hypothetical protein